jgi:hypothetical protein
MAAPSLSTGIPRMISSSGWAGPLAVPRNKHHHLAPVSLLMLFCLIGLLPLVVLFPLVEELAFSPSMAGPQTPLLSIILLSLTAAPLALAPLRDLSQATDQAT